MTKNAGNYEQIVAEVYRKDGTVQKVGFREGRWIAETLREKVAVSKNGFLLYLKHNEQGETYFYDLFASFAEMATDEDIDLLLLSQVATAIGADYVTFLDEDGRKNKMLVVADLSPETRQLLAERIDELGAELAVTKEYETLFIKYLQLQKKLIITDTPEQKDNLLFELDGITDSQLAAVEKFFYIAGFNDALRTFSANDDEEPCSYRLLTDNRYFTAVATLN
jgi:hypothetical protein